MVFEPSGNPPAGVVRIYGGREQIEEWIQSPELPGDGDPSRDAAQQSALLRRGARPERLVEPYDGEKFDGREAMLLDPAGILVELHALPV
mgnify:CR=1 FL=1